MVGGEERSEAWRLHGNGRGVRGCTTTPQRLLRSRAPEPWGLAPNKRTRRGHTRNSSEGHQLTVRLVLGQQGGR